MVFRRESKNIFVISDLMDSSPNKKTEDLKKDHLRRQRHVLVLLLMRKAEKTKKNKKQTDSCAEDKKEK